MGLSGQDRRDNPLSANRVELLDLHELVSQLEHKRDRVRSLESQLQQVEEQAALFRAQLHGQLSSKQQQQVSYEHCQALQRWTTAETALTVHKLLGTEMVTAQQGKIICNIICQEEKNLLPPKLFIIDKIQGTEFFTLKLTEIFYYLDISDSLRDLIMSSSQEDIIKCFQEMQSLVFDVVERDCVFNLLSSKTLTSESLVCLQNRMCISFNIPLDRAIINRPIWRARNKMRSGIHTTQSLLEGYLCINMFVFERNSSGWATNLYCKTDPNLSKLPVHLMNPLKRFLLDVPRLPLLGCITRLLDSFDVLQLNNHEDDDVDELAGGLF